MEHTEIVQQLLAAGANTAAVPINGTTPLLTAARHGGLEAVQLLLAAGANMEAPLHTGTTPLYEAASQGHPDVVELLLASGANPRVVANGRSMLAAVAAEGIVGILDMLLQSWGQPAVTAAELAEAAKQAAADDEMPAFAWLAQQLHKLHPTELRLLFEGEDPVPPADAAAAVLHARASAVGTKEDLQAELQAREEDVADEQHELEQLVVHVAGISKGVVCLASS
jgi:hypothetical protein